DEFIEITQDLDAHGLIEKAQRLHALHPHHLNHPLGILAGGIEPFDLFAASFVVLLVDPFSPPAAEIKGFEIILDVQWLVGDREYPAHITAAEPADLEQCYVLLCLICKMRKQD